MSKLENRMFWHSTRDISYVIIYTTKALRFISNKIIISAIYISCKARLKIAWYKRLRFLCVKF